MARPGCRKRGCEHVYTEREREREPKKRVHIEHVYIYIYTYIVKIYTYTNAGAKVYTCDVGGWECRAPKCSDQPLAKSQVLRVFKVRRQFKAVREKEESAPKDRTWEQSGTCPAPRQEYRRKQKQLLIYYREQVREKELRDCKIKVDALASKQNRWNLRPGRIKKGKGRQC